ncbi:MAG: RDD family protein [Daejeonella sp.]
MEQYDVVVNGKPTGPYSLDELKGLNIKADTFVKTSVMDDYKEAHELPRLRELLGFKASIILPQYFASLDVRLLATIIDYFIVFLIYAFLATFIVVFINQQQLRILVSLSGLAIIPAAKLIYSTFMEASPRQGTYGKILMGIKITDEQGSKITFGQAFIRNLSKLICMLTLGAGYLMGFFDKRQQCLHDKIAATLVIKDRLM